MKYEVIQPMINSETFLLLYEFFWARIYLIDRWGPNKYCYSISE